MNTDELGALTAMLRIDSEEAGKRLRRGWYRDPGRDDGSWARWQQRWWEVRFRMYFGDKADEIS